MSLPIIVVGDKTDHGGVVVTGAPNQSIHGKPMARVGDEVSCPKHGKTVIVEGHGSLAIAGVPVAVQGCKTSCGAVLIGSESASVG